MAQMQCWWGRVGRHVGHDGGVIIRRKSRVLCRIKEENSIINEEVKTLSKFKSRHNLIQVIEVSRRAEHPLAGSRLLLLDSPGNIHSISFLFKSLTNTYFDIFAMLPPLLPPGPIALLGFGAGSAARLLLDLYPDLILHGWEIDPSVIAVGREFFGLDVLEKKHYGRLHVYIGDALNAGAGNAFAGIVVDLFARGSVIPELQEVATWRMLRRKLVRGGRVMVNVGGRCVEAEEKGREGGAVMEATLKVLQTVFGNHNVHVLHLGQGSKEEDSAVALTGTEPQWEMWRNKLPPDLKPYVDLWKPLTS